MVETAAPRVTLSETHDRASSTDRDARAIGQDPASSGRLRDARLNETPPISLHACAVLEARRRRYNGTRPPRGRSIQIASIGDLDLKAFP